MTKAIWMSDLHFTSDGLVAERNPRTELKKTISHMVAHHSDADFCFLTGDLVDRGTYKDYHALSLMLADLPMPFYPMMGNHDARAHLRETLPLPEGVMSDFIQYKVITEREVFVCLDTHKPGSDAGEFCENRRNWLTEALEDARDKAVYVFMHHPPLALGLPMQDQDRLDEGDAFLDLISAYPNIAYMGIGHVHRPITGVVRGIPFATMRSALYQAPPPVPHWDWASFRPANEAPNIGIMHITGPDMILQYETF